MARVNQYDKKNVIVTGGAGFIGSHLCDLLAQKNKVICIDNFSTGQEENIHQLLPNPNFEFVKHDLSEPLDLAALKELRAFQVPFQGIQEIYHLASPSSPKDYTKLTVETLAANALGTKHVLDMAKQYNAKFLLLSSGSIYGEPVQKTPFPENYFGYVNPVGIRSPYQEGKRFAEALTVAYRNRFKLEAKIARLFNTYGPRMRFDDGRMIPTFIGAAIKNMPIIIHGDRNDISSYCYITDALEGIVRLMSSKEMGPINIGHPEEHTVFDIAQRIVKITGGRSDIRVETPMEYNAKQAIPSVRLAREQLGWFPVVPLEEGLLRTIDYMKGLRQVEFSDMGFGAE